MLLIEGFIAPFNLVQHTELMIGGDRQRLLRTHILQHNIREPVEILQLIQPSNPRPDQIQIRLFRPVQLHICHPPRGELEGIVLLDTTIPITQTAAFNKRNMDAFPALRLFGIRKEAELPAIRMRQGRIQQFKQGDRRFRYIGSRNIQRYIDFASTNCRGHNSG
ncbi:hypothetical protein D3C85_1365960 [compost metagenome]